jgi:hypothetical protein
VVTSLLSSGQSATIPFTKGNSKLSMTTQRLKVLQRDGYQCQICPATCESPDTKLEVHHIRPRAEGGTNDLDNLVTLCDLCYAICHWHLGPWACGVSKLPRDQQEEARTFVLKRAQPEFQDFLSLPPSERTIIRNKMQKMLGVSSGD